VSRGTIQIIKMFLVIACLVASVYFVHVGDKMGSVICILYAIFLKMGWGERWDV
jgi:hypothetical protein